MATKKNILIVEDEKPLSGILADKLKREGYEIREAANGEEGLKAIKSKKPDLILLDIIMPKMDGMTMISKLREDKKSKDIPVIILTNLSDVDKAEEAMKANVKDYLIKSDWTLEDLIKKIKSKIK